MNILLTNLVIGGLSGTEQHTRTLAHALTKRGHVVAVYSPSAEAGSLVRLQADLRVCHTLDAVGFEPDVIHCHHLPCAVDAVMRWPRAASLFVVHDATAWHDALPPLEAFDLVAAVDQNCANRAIREAPGITVRIVPNPIDRQRIVVARRNRRPRSLLIYGKSAGKRSWNRVLRLAALANGIYKFQVLQGDRDPLSQIGRFDIILASARCAMEACLSGAYTILFDRGLFGGPVTPHNVRHLLMWNLGRGVLDESLTYTRFRQMIRDYSPDAALESSRILQPLVDPEAIAAEFESLYRSCIEIRAQRTPNLPLLTTQLAFARNMAGATKPSSRPFPSSREFFRARARDAR